MITRVGRILDDLKKDVKAYLVRILDDLTRDVKAYLVPLPPEYRREMWRTIRKDLVVILFPVLTQIAIEEAPHVFTRFKPYILPLREGLLKHSGTVALVLAMVALILGALASYWKQRGQRSYGMAEVAFGALLSYNAVLHLSPNFEFSKLFAIGTAIYVIARGFNNLSDARKAPSMAWRAAELSSPVRA
jgi:hypothetical protein